MLIISDVLEPAAKHDLYRPFPMKIAISKWHGTGNDFILVDDRTSVFPIDRLDLVRQLCDRHFGIGSDGLILIQAPKDDRSEFHMEFFNPDGSRSFCGNGSRCAYAFWCQLTGHRDPARFTAIDGAHEGRWIADLVSISLNDVDRIDRKEEQVDFVHNGSPHELVWVQDPDHVDLIGEGRRRRNDPKYAPGGTNVNFLNAIDGAIAMRTYERGVEDETLSCGTGVVAAALSALDRKKASSPVEVRTRGGQLSVEAISREGKWTEIRLIGPAVEVFTGMISV